MVRARFQSGRCCISQDPPTTTDWSPLGRMTRYTLIAWPQFFMPPAAYKSGNFSFPVSQIPAFLAEVEDGLEVSGTRIMLLSVKSTRVNEIVVTFSTRSKCCHVDSLLNSVLGPLNLCWKDPTVSEWDHKKNLFLWSCSRSRLQDLWVSLVLIALHTSMGSKSRGWVMMSTNPRLDRTTSEACKCWHELFTSPAESTTAHYVGYFPGDLKSILSIVFTVLNTDIFRIRYSTEQILYWEY